MQMYSEADQVSLFGQGGCAGKMCPYALKHINDVMNRKQLCKAPPKNAEKQHH